MLICCYFDIVALKRVVVVRPISQASVRTSSMVSGQRVVPGRGRLCSN